MKKVKKILYSIFAVFVANIVLIKNVVFADVVTGTSVPDKSEVSLTLIFVLLVVTITGSILLLIYKQNEAEKKNKIDATNDSKGE